MLSSRAVTPVPPDAVRRELEKILCSEAFTRSHRLSRFLRFTVERALAGAADQIKEYSIGVEVFDKGPSFDPRTENIVRVEARRLRVTLTEYYSGAGRGDPVVIELPKGAYAPVFRSQQTAPAGSSIAVLPFDDMSAAADQEYFCDGLTDEIINALTRVPGLKVVARTSAFQFKRKHHDVREIGERLNVDVVLEGSVRKDGSRLRVMAQLNSAKDGYHLWSERYEREMHDIFAIQDEIALAIAETLKVQQTKLWPGIRRPLDVETYNLYLQGQYCWKKWTPAGVLRSLEYFQAAIARDPSFVPAYVGLGDAYGVLGYLGVLPLAEAKSKKSPLTAKALELDESYGDAHFSRAAELAHMDFNWAAAEPEFRRGLELNPGSASGRWLYATVLAQLARLQEARNQIDRGLELDPLSTSALILSAKIHMFQGDQESAMRDARKAVEIDPAHALTFQTLGAIHSRLEQHEQAIDCLRKSLLFSRERTEAAGELANVYYKCNRREQLVNLLDEVASRPGAAALDVALIHAALGDMDRARSLVEKAIAHREGHVTWLKVEPRFDLLRTMPEYPGFLHRLNLPA